MTYSSGQSQCCSNTVHFEAGLSELTMDVRSQMAELAEPTLLEIIRRHGDSTEPLPAHCFVFGLHFSRHLLTIFIHFPVKITDGEYQFHQFLIVHQSITALQNAFYPYIPRLNFDLYLSGMDDWAPRTLRQRDTIPGHSYTDFAI